MKLRILSLLCILLSLSSCNEKALKTEYTHTVPANAQRVAYINLDALMEKAGDAVPASVHHLSKLTGIDRTAPAYAFQSPVLPGYAVALRVNDLTLLKVTLTALAAEGTCTSPAQAEGYSYVLINNPALMLAYNDGTLLVISDKNTTELNKLHPAITALMHQSVEQSIHTHPHFSAMTAQKGDIRLMTTPDALSFSLRSILNHPQGTWLLARMTFENGHLYTTVRQADFRGETHESNQPFTPTSQRELQAAMMQMMSGRSFHIVLTGEELLTLTNLRILMELAPDEKTRCLYDLVMKIERVSARGDKRSTSFTVVLKDKATNALKQLAEYWALLK